MLWWELKSGRLRMEYDTKEWPINYFSFWIYFWGTFGNSHGFTVCGLVSISSMEFLGCDFTCIKSAIFIFLLWQQECRHILWKLTSIYSPPNPQHWRILPENSHRVDIGLSVFVKHLIFPWKCCHTNMPPMYIIVKLPTFFMGEFALDLTMLA